jgi:hypothetical protein
VFEGRFQSGLSGKNALLLLLLVVKGMCLWDKNSQELRKSKRSSKKFPKEIM